MGNSTSSPVNNNFSKFTTRIYTATPSFSEAQSVNFSRNDLLNTISELSLTDVFNKHSDTLIGGAIPTRDRYSQYETTKKMQTAGGMDVATLSSVNSNDIQDIKNMILGNQNGGCGCGSPAPTLAEYRATPPQSRIRRHSLRVSEALTPPPDNLL